MITSKRQRILIVSDAKNEADDQYAIVHALLTPRFRVVGMVASHFSGAKTNLLSYNEMIKLANLTRTIGMYPIKIGAEGSMKEEQLNHSEGSDLIVQEALKADADPLYIVCIGALTDVGTAITINPEIVDRFTLIWVGGGRYPTGSHEANLNHDILAANRLFSSKVNLWQIPSEAYKTMLVSVTELQLKLSTVNELGNYLYEQLIQFATDNVNEKNWINTECWVMGDSAAIGVLLDEQKGNYKLIAPPHFASNCQHMTSDDNNRPIRVYQSLNVRMILEDFFAKVSLFEMAAKGVKQSD
ncbi:nucleoside hydrolase [Vagococcus sp. BWB3-3]|uniref:Nucleoside hydrolase n=1 Tax=Vagococcus allomyrinae TaxID=2794353 RepID=A0A940PDC5_9ENTE|nr:nucleoside hydrolase [Vagococcus allomyrinae]MBP1042497.1 nucleoside hydrolase [Vagococcus allomyrinae]